MLRLTSGIAFVFFVKFLASPQLATCKYVENGLPFIAIGVLYILGAMGVFSFSIFGETAPKWLTFVTMGAGAVFWLIHWSESVACVKSFDVILLITSQLAVALTQLYKSWRGFMLMPYG